MEIVFQNLDLLLVGGFYTLLITVVSMTSGFILGLIIALLRLTEKNVLVLITKAYVSIIRGTPLLVQLFIVYYGLPDMGITLDPITASIITLTINAASFLSETIRGAIISVPRGQMEACMALGMTYIQALKRVILPQALRVAIPPLGNTFIGMLKQTSLVSIITVTELLRASQLLIAKYFIIMPFYIAIACIYWLMSTLFSVILNKIEKKLAQSY